jgi:sugar phosphate isomerase/epimerase
MGYEGVELTGTGPYQPAELKELLDDLGLEPAGIHMPLTELEDNLEECIEVACGVETTNIVCPFLPEERRQSREDWLELASILDDVGAQCRGEGLRLSYHNHSFEFVQFDGEYALDLMLRNCRADNVYSELDTYWVKHGGAEPVDYINKYAGRISILHLKDMADDEEQSFAEVGSGILDWPAIDAAARAAGVQYYCVEQDRCAGDPMDSARQSAEFVRELLEG